jgi:hypothetical protein
VFFGSGLIARGPAPSGQRPCSGLTFASTLALSERCVIRAQCKLRSAKRSEPSLRVSPVLECWYGVELFICMSLSAETRLGLYEILAPIGAGGMGEVCRARDPRLNRDVAVKVSQERFSDHFEREARAVAALNHLNICTLYDVGPDYLVMEFIEGEIAQGTARAGGSSAHRAPDRRSAGGRAREGHRASRSQAGQYQDQAGRHGEGAGFRTGEDCRDGVGRPTELAHAHHLADPRGNDSGRGAYMSPEQARGKTVDKRADIWSFGVVLYELLTGRTLFQGDDLTEVLASAVKEEPRLEEVPLQVRRLLGAAWRKTRRSGCAISAMPGHCWRRRQERRPMAFATNGCRGWPPRSSPTPSWARPARCPPGRRATTWTCAPTSGPSALWSMKRYR